MGLPLLPQGGGVVVRAGGGRVRGWVFVLGLMGVRRQLQLVHLRLQQLQKERRKQPN